MQQKQSPTKGGAKGPLQKGAPLHHKYYGKVFHGSLSQNTFGQGVVYLTAFKDKLGSYEYGGHFLPKNLKNIYL